MTPWPILLIAVGSTFLCLYLWFREVRRIMQERKNTVESALGQLATCWEKAHRARGDPEVSDVFARSENIYRQAVDLYNRTLKNPWYCLPAYLMGFRHIS